MGSGSGDCNHRVALGSLGDLDRKTLKSSGGPSPFGFHQDYEPRGEDANGEFSKLLVIQESQTWRAMLAPVTPSSPGPGWLPSFWAPTH